METNSSPEHWWKFWIADWLSMTRTCSPGAKGVCIDMMCQAIQHGQPYGYLRTASGLPMPEAKLARIANTAVAAFRQFMDELLEADVFVKGPDGVLFSPYLVAKKARRDVKSAAGVAGMKARWGKPDSVIADVIASAITPAITPVKASVITHVASSFLPLASGFSPSDPDPTREREEPRVPEKEPPPASVPPNTQLDFVAASSLLAFLNEKSGASFPETPGFLHEIALRLVEVKGDVDGVRAMIENQCAQWKNDARMARFLRPSTLFDSVKFHEYFGQRNAPPPGGADNPARTNAVAVNGRMQTVTRRLAELGDSANPPDMKERRELKRELAGLQEQQRKAAGQ
jgi:uncharacterized phage protein (TIGR02220 family)